MNTRNRAHDIKKMIQWLMNKSQLAFLRGELLTGQLLTSELPWGTE